MRGAGSTQLGTIGGVGTAENAARAQPQRTSAASGEIERTTRHYAGARGLRYLFVMDRDSTCPTCKGVSLPYPDNRAHPFCSRRCKLADLSNWFNERYAVPAEPGQLDEMPDDGSDERLLN